MTTSKKEQDPVETYMTTLKHPLKKELELLRTIIRTISPMLSERIKWNAPSYYYKADLFTFNLHDKKQIRLIFHHPSIVNIKSELLLGEYKDRRIMYFGSAKEIKTHTKELKKIIKQQVVLVEKQ